MLESESSHPLFVLEALGLVCNGSLLSGRVTILLHLCSSADDVLSCKLSRLGVFPLVFLLSLVEDGVSLVHGVGVLVDLLGLRVVHVRVLGFLGHVDNLQHVLLQRLFLKVESVFVPNEVGGLGVKSVSLHAGLKEPNDKSVVRVLSEAKFSAVIHVLFELLGVSLAEIVNRNFELLLLDIVILLVLASARKTLPRKTASQEVK